MSPEPYERLLAEATEPDLLTREELLEDLAKTRQAIDAANHLVEELYARRLMLFQAARSMTPPVTQRVLAEVAGVTETAVITALKRPR